MPIWYALLASFLLLVPVLARAQDFPAPNATRVVDAANLMSAGDEAALDARLAAFEQKTGRQFVVATIPDLQGFPIEDYGYQLGRAWGIGSKEKNDGVLLIVAPKDRKVRIEVGYGLEPYLTDAYSSVIINRFIVPKFKAQDYAGGISAGADAIMQQLQLSPEEAAARVKAAATAPRKDQDGFPVALIFWGFVLIFVVLPALFGRRRGRRYGGMPIVLWGPGDFGGRSGGFGSSGGFGGFSGGGGSFGGGGSSGSW
ncbi:MAG: TPM domain-containing protein [Chakrabartia sp.]